MTDRTRSRDTSFGVEISNLLVAMFVFSFFIQFIVTVTSTEFSNSIDCDPGWTKLQHQCYKVLCTLNLSLATMQN